MGKFFENIEVHPQDVKDLKELIPLTINQDEDFNKYTTIKKVKDGDPVAFIGDMDDVGVAGGGCDPEYQEVGIANKQKRWELGDWNIPIKICYEALKGTIAEHCLKTGTAIGDLTSTEFMTYIIRPALERQMMRMIWRFGWFGNKNIQAVSEGGVLTDDVKKELFTTCDGLFLRIFAQCAENEKQLTSIVANQEDTFAAAKAKMLVKGTATGLVDSMLMDADSRITADSGSVILMTKWMADALHWDVKERFNTIMPWEKVFDGFEVAKYDGVTIARISIWDRFIAAYEKSGEKFNLPYRMVFGNIKNFMIGSDQDGLISDLDVWFDRKERRNYIYSQGKIGTNLLEDDMFHAAY